MNGLRCAPMRASGIALLCALLMPSFAMAAPQPVNPETIHLKIVRRGVGSWICVEEKNGIALVGRITFIDDHGFGLQLNNYPEITTFAYGDVNRLRTGLGTKGAVILIAGTAGAAVATGLIMHHEFEENKPQLPTLPPSPVLARP